MCACAYYVATFEDVKKKDPPVVVPGTNAYYNLGVIYV